MGEVGYGEAPPLKKRLRTGGVSFAWWGRRMESTQSRTSPTPQNRFKSSLSYSQAGARCSHQEDCCRYIICTEAVHRHTVCTYVHTVHSAHNTVHLSKATQH